MTIQPKPRRLTGWIAPRSGGYRPGGEFSAKMATSRKPPKGGAGVVTKSSAKKVIPK